MKNADLKLQLLPRKNWLLSKVFAIVFIFLSVNESSGAVVRCEGLFNGSVAFNKNLVHSANSESILAIKGPPVGVLVPIDNWPQSRGSQRGQFYKDEKGEIWFLKKDIKHTELQTSAEVISAWIYRHFNYAAPETYIVTLHGIRYSASRILPPGKDTNLRDDMPNTPHYRAMRVVAAFLKDWDRTRSLNNRIYTDGSVASYDFGGTLGARAEGEIKPGVIFSEAIGSFGSPKTYEIYGKKSSQSWNRQWLGEHPMKELFDSYNVDRLATGHPWKSLTLNDVRLILEYFRTLDTEKIIEIVDRAQYSNRRDQLQMIESLIVRRNAFLEYLLDYLGDNSPPDKGSYWARQNPLPDLSYEVRDNRPARMSSDVARFVQSLTVSKDHVILFRGQENLTNQVLSPLARQAIAEGRQLLKEDEQEEYFLKMLNSAQMELNHEREEISKYRSLGALKTGEVRWWDRATAADYLAQNHSKSNGHPFFISTTRSLGVASRWVETGRFPTTYRYVYVISVPQNKTLPITQSLIAKRGSNNEDEVVILYNATPYVIAVYDTVAGVFLKENIGGN